MAPAQAQAGDREAVQGAYYGCDEWPLHDRGERILAEVPRVRAPIMLVATPAVMNLGMIH